MPRRSLRGPGAADGALSTFLLSPYLLAFVAFILVPIVAAMALSFTSYDTVQTPRSVGFRNYIALITQDQVFMQKVLPNTFTFVLIVGPGGYLLSFLLAWMLAQVPRVLRSIFALVIYMPSMVGGVFIAVVWRTIFSGDRAGYANALLMSWGLRDTAIQWLQSSDYLLPIMIVVSIWSSMGVGFLAMLAGILNINEEIYEAAYMDGMRTRFQEIFYITIPSMKPQMLFGAVMSVVSTFAAGEIGVQLTGANPTPQNAGQLVVNHMQDYAFLRYEMGYAAAIAVVLLAMVALLSRLAYRLFGERE